MLKYLLELKIRSWVYQLMTRPEDTTRHQDPRWLTDVMKRRHDATVVYTWTLIPVTQYRFTCPIRTEWMMELSYFIVRVRFDTSAFDNFFIYQLGMCWFHWLWFIKMFVNCKLNSFHTIAESRCFPNKDVLLYYVLQHGLNRPEEWQHSKQFPFD